MAANTPWCPRCGDWRGHLENLCSGCRKVEELLAEKLPGVTTDPKTKLAVPTADATIEQKQLLVKSRATATAERFSFICEKRTEREAYTQMLEMFVDERLDQLKTLHYEWGQLRAQASQYRFSNMYALEMTSAMELALTEMSGMSLELSKYDKNKPVHDERMQRIMSWMDVMHKFRRPEASPPIEEHVEEADVEERP